PGAPLLEEEAVQPVAELDPGEPVARQPELDADRPQQLLARERRVEDEGDLGIGAEPLEQRPAEGGLPGTDLARDRDEALALLDPVEDVRQRLAVRGGEEEEARIGRQGERLLAKPVELGIHRKKPAPGM